MKPTWKKYLLYGSVIVVRGILAFEKGSVPLTSLRG
jgi:hypothetical protein